MSKSAMAATEELEMKLETAVPPEVMEKRRHLAGLIRARMAEPATPTDIELWQEFKAEIERERLTFRS